MTNRREFVRGSVGFSLGAFTLRRALARGDALESLQPDPAAALVAIADWSFTASVEFAEEAARAGIDTHGFDGDVGGLWLREIEPKLATGTTALVGLSGAGVLFCLETMARSHGCGGVFRAVRPPAGGEGWPRVAARHALATAAAVRLRGGRVLPPIEHLFRPSDEEPPLHVWAIARAARPTALPDLPR